MAGSSQRRGAIRKPGTKKGPTVGSGGQRRRGLAGKGPTPAAADRPNHKAYKKAQAAKRSAPPARHRTKNSGREVVAGRNSVLESLRTGVPVSAVHIAPRMERDERVTEILKIAVDEGLPVMETPRAELDRMTDGAVHQGVAATVPAYEYAHPGDLMNPEAPGAPLLVALDGITDPRNLGAIVRSVGAFGGHGVIVPARRSAGMTASAWKTSAGAAARIPVAQATNLTRALEEYRKAGFFVIGLDGDGDTALPGLALADRPLVVVVGSEGKGLSRLVRETCDAIVSIPITSAVESLNAGMAVAVTLYEVAQRRLGEEKK